MLIYEHLESYLGPIVQGWGTDENSLGIEVSLFQEIDNKDVNTFSTLGLSKKVLNIGNKDVRQELVFSAYNKFSSDDISSFLMTFAESVAKTGKGLLRGEVVEGHPLIEGVSVSGIYASIPVLWPDDFHILNDTSPSTIIVWLIPVTHQEANIIRHEGWNYFEDILEASNCDFWDLNRISLL